MAKIVIELDSYADLERLLGAKDVKVAEPQGDTLRVVSWYNVKRFILNPEASAELERLSFYVPKRYAEG